MSDDAIQNDADLFDPKDIDLKRFYLSLPPEGRQMIGQSARTLIATMKKGQPKHYSFSIAMALEAVTKLYRLVVNIVGRAAQAGR